MYTEPKKSEHNENNGSENLESDPEKNYNFKILYFMFFSVYLGRTLIMPLLTFYADALYKESGHEGRLSDTHQGLLAALFYFTYAISGLTFGPLSMRFGRKPVLLLCSIGITVGFLCQMCSLNYEMLLISRTLSGFFAAVNGLTQSYISDICAPQFVPKYTARVGLIFGLVFGLGPLLAVVVVEVVDSIFDTCGIFQGSITAKYRAGCAFGAVITSFASIIGFLYLKESLPDSFRTKRKSKKKSKIFAHMNQMLFDNKEHKKMDAVKLISVIGHPDNNRVMKVILNIMNSGTVTKQVRFNMLPDKESIEDIAKEVVIDCKLHQEYYYQPILDIIQEAKQDFLASEANDNLAVGNILSTIVNNAMGNNSSARETLEKDIEVSRDVNILEYDTKYNSMQLAVYDGMDDSVVDDDSQERVVQLFEALLPDEERTPEFRARLKKYLILTMICVVLIDWITSVHATIFALLHDGTRKDGLTWSAKQFGVSFAVYGLSYSSVQFFYVRLQKQFGPFLVGAFGAFAKLLGCALIPQITLLCRSKYMHYPHSNSSYAYLEYLLHSPASILIGLGYGLANTAAQTIISDFAKRYDIRSVGNWLGCYMCSVAIGSGLVLILGIISKSIGPLDTFYVAAALASVTVLIYVWVHSMTRDIQIAVDIKQVIEQGKEINQILGGEGGEGEENESEDDGSHSRTTRHTLKRDYKYLTELDISRLTSKFSLYRQSTHTVTPADTSHQHESEPHRLSSQLTSFHGHDSSHNQITDIATAELIMNENEIPDDASITAFHEYDGSQSYMRQQSSSISIGSGRMLPSRRNTLSQVSLMRSVSAFMGISSPFGLPIVTPAVLKGIPIANLQQANNNRTMTQNVNVLKHLDIKNEIKFDGLKPNSDIQII